MMDSHDSGEDIGTHGFELVDAHCHLDAPSFATDREAVIERASRAGVVGFVVAGYDPRERSFALAAPEVRIGVGLHPWIVSDDEAITRAQLDAFESALGRADFVGEIGLDRIHAERGGASLERQRVVFSNALSIARDSERPIVLHVVGAHALAVGAVRDAARHSRLVVHGFVGSLETARRWVTAGASLSFGFAALGSERTLQVASELPEDRILIETDSPGGPLTLETPIREPASLVEVARTIARARGIGLPELARITTANARRIFFET